jgi:hypothetical protein
MTDPGVDGRIISRKTLTGIARERMNWIHLVQGNFFISSMIMMLHGRATASTPVLGPTEPLFQRVSAVASLKIKRPESDADRSLPSSAEVKNAGAVPPLPHIPSLTKHRHNFTFTWR